MLRRATASLVLLSIVIGGCGGPGAASPGASEGGSPAVTPSPAPSLAASTPSSVASPKVPAPTALIQPGIVVDCVDIEYPPMEFFPAPGVTDPQQAVGFDVDAARAVAVLWNLPLQIRNTAFEALIPDLQAGRCDIVWTGLYISAKRLQVADAVPYMATGQVVMVPAGNPKGIKSLDDLCGKSVSIQTGGLVEQRINEASKACTSKGLPAISIQGYPKTADEFQQIVVGRVDAVWETDTAVSNWMLQHPGQYEVGVALPKDDSYGVYYQKGNADVGDALRAALRSLKTDGTLAGIAKRYQIDPATLDVIK
jgi:polar amino acid transport system substrate-binding protein